MGHNYTQIFRKMLHLDGIIFNMKAINHKKKRYPKELFKNFALQIYTNK
ncbi:hypothetical protein BH10BAC1_BH10BAC1_06660 [soil metagenome]